MTFTQPTENVYPMNAPRDMLLPTSQSTYISQWPFLPCLSSRAINGNGKITAVHGSYHALTKVHN